MTPGSWGRTESHRGWKETRQPECLANNAGCAVGLRLRRVCACRRSIPRGNVSSCPVRPTRRWPRTLDRIPAYLAADAAYPDYAAHCVVLVAGVASVRAARLRLSPLLLLLPVDPMAFRHRMRPHFLSASMMRPRPSHPPAVRQLRLPPHPRHADRPRRLLRTNRWHRCLRRPLSSTRVG